MGRKHRFREAITYLYSWQGARSRLSDVARVFGVSTATISRRLKKWDVPTRRTGARYKHNEQAFSEPLSPRAEYWIGALLADGNVSDKGGIRLSVHEDDRDWVVAFRDFVAPDVPVRGTLVRHPYEARYVRQYYVRLYSELIRTALADFGIVPRKTGLEYADPRLADSPHFWRGVVDGDGSIQIARRGTQPKLYLYSASGMLLKQYTSFLDNHGIVTQVRSYEPGYYLVVLTSAKAMRALHVLYGDLTDSDFLPRKAEQAAACMDLYQTPSKTTLFSYGETS